MEDTLYKQNLAEWVYDEKKLVTYHYLSITLGVHVNLAKQMLYEFYKQDSAKNGEETLEAIFFVSGTQDTTSENDESGKCYTSTLCLTDKLDDLKNKYSKIYSVHIYSVKQAKSKDTLEKAMSEILELELRNDGRAGPEYGPFKIIKPLSQAKHTITIKNIPKKAELKIDAGNIKTIKSEQAPGDTLEEEELKKVETKIYSEKLPRKKEPDENFKSETKHESSSSLSSTKKKEVQNGGKDRLKSMFANAKPPKPKPKEVKNEDPPSTPHSKHGSGDSSGSRKRPINSHSKSARQNNNTSKKVETAQRRRIKVFSSSSEESDSNSSHGENNGDSDSESPIPKRRQIESDSESDDEDFKKLVSPRKESTTLEKPCLPPGKPGRRRVTKTVTKRLVDEDGYTVVKKEQITVSESESDTEGKKVIIFEKDCVRAEAAGSETPVKSNPRENNGTTSKTSESTPTPTSSKRSSNSQQSINGKAKQASITSFFQKKV